MRGEDEANYLKSPFCELSGSVIFKYGCAFNGYYDSRTYPVSVCFVKVERFNMHDIGRFSNSFMTFERESVIKLYIYSINLLSVTCF